MPRTDQYTPPAGYSGPDSFTFTVNDGLDDSAPATVSITVTENVVPVAMAQSVATAKNVPVNITLTGSDGNNGPSPLTFSFNDAGTLGTVSGSGSNVTYTPPTGYSGPDSFTFTVNDGLDISAPATVNVTVLGGTPGSIGYTFETPANISGTGVDTVYTAPDTNTFGPGITVSNFTMTDRDATEYSRFNDMGNAGTSIKAAVGGGGTALTASFTVNISEDVVVDLTGIQYETFFRFVTNNNNANITQTFTTSVGGNSKTSSWVKNSNADFWPNPDNPVSVPLSGLIGLTNTSVTFTWSFDDDKSNLFSQLTHGVDDIVLTGTVTPAEKVGPLYIELVSGGDNVQLSWMSVNGRTYGVEGTDDLTADDWTPIETDIAGTGEFIMKTYDITEVGERYFFRVSLEPESGEAPLPN